MEIEVTAKIDKRDEDKIFQKLYEYNLPKFDFVTPKDLAVFIRDDDDEVIGGLVGHTFGLWFIIKTLWVDKTLRNKGFGSKILQMAEDEAIKRGCKFVFVDTYNFQAPLFYRKFGYEEVLELENYPVVGKRQYFRKNLPEVTSDKKETVLLPKDKQPS